MHATERGSCNLQLYWWIVPGGGLATGGVEFGGQSCKMSQIWQIYLCKNIKKLGSLWEYKTGSFLGTL